jgi:hypothetical protein
MPANIDNDSGASLKRSAGVLFVCGVILFFLAIFSDAARFMARVGTLNATGAKSAEPTVPSLAEGKTAITGVLVQIYAALTRGEPTAAAPFLAPSILQDAGMLDRICRPFTYRAHYLEAIVERPDPNGLIFQARVRVLFKPLEEHADTMIFRMIEGRYVLFEVRESGEDWFGPQKAEAAEVVRRFLYAAKAGENEIARQTVSAHFPFSEFVGNAEVQKRLGWIKEVDISGRGIEQLQGLKFAIVVTFPECFGTIANKRFYLDRLGGQLKIVRAFDKTNLPTLCEWPDGVGDPEIEAYTLKRFGIASAPPAEVP